MKIHVDTLINGMIVLFDTRDAMKFTGFSKERLLQLARKGKIKGRQFPHSGAWIFLQSDLQAYRLHQSTSPVDSPEFYMPPMAAEDEAEYALRPVPKKHPPVDAVEDLLN